MKTLIKLMTLCSVLLISVSLPAKYMTGYTDPKLRVGEIAITFIGDIRVDSLYQWHLVIECQQKRKDGKPGKKFLAYLEAWTQEQKNILTRSKAKTTQGNDVCLRVSYLGTHLSIINGRLPIYLIEKEVK